MIDHEALWRTTRATLDALSSLKISRFRVSMLNDGEVFVGGFGDVRQAKLRTFLFGKDPVVALKLLRPTWNREQRIRVIASLARELHVWEKLKHPNILTLTGFYFDAASLTKAWIATPWQKTGNLFKYVQDAPLDEKTRLKLVMDTIHGLEYLHSLSPPVCHGDIKAENTLIDENGNAQLCDFGLAKILEDVPSGLTTTSASNCSVRYAAPELLHDDSSHTLESDMWAWGCLTLVIMTGLLPYHNHNRETSTLLAIKTGELPCKLSDIDMHACILSLVTACWQKDSGNRPTSVKCQDELDTLLGFFPAADLPPDEIPSRYKTWGRGWTAIHNLTSRKKYEFEFMPNLFPPHPIFAFSPDGQSVAVSSLGKDDVHLCEVETGRKLRELDFSSHRTNSTIREDTGVSAISFSHSGSLLAIGHKNGDVWIWNFPTQTLRCELKGHQSEISAVAFLHSDTILVSACYVEDSVRTWNVEKGTLLHKIRVQDARNVVGLPHHSFVIAVDWNRGENAMICDAELGRAFDVPKTARAAAFIGDGSTFITGGREAGLTTWDLRPLLEHRERRVNGGVLSWYEAPPPADLVATLSLLMPCLLRPRSRV